MQAPWKFRLDPHLGTLYYNVWLNTGKQFANAGTEWEVDGWNTGWGSTEPSDELRFPTTNTRDTPSPHGNPMWLAPVDFGKWQYFLYRIRWRNDWTGIFECWTRTQDESSWRMVANYHDFPTRVYQDGDLNTNLYSLGLYYRGDANGRQALDYGGRARSNSVTDASLGTASAGFQELAALANFPA